MKRNPVPPMPSDTDPKLVEELLRAFESLPIGNRNSPQGQGMKQRMAEYLRGKKG